ncbi:MAG: hypothetical protein E7011_02215 [Alphaproteobacteria bacterium]|nr:hypothetical protein [Alphaproteobacteria bacterium]
MSYKIYKRKTSPVYYARISVRINGQTKLERFSTHESSRDKALEIARMAEQKLLAHNGAVDITIEQAFGEFYKRESQNYTAPKNIYYALSQFSAFFGGLRPFSSLTNADINNFIYSRQVEGRAPATINRQLVILSKVISTCKKKWGFVAPDVHPLEFKLREPDGRIGLVNDDDRQKIMDAAAPHLKLAMQIAYYTGLRKGNILSLRWDEIDTERWSITKFIKDSNFKGGRAHTVFIPDALKSILQAIPHTCDYVIAIDGKPIKDLKTAWHAACRRAGIPHRKYTFHDVRHGSATAVVRTTNSLYAAQVFLGHKSPKMTQRYAKFLDEDKIRIAHSVFDNK